LFSVITKDNTNLATEFDPAMYAKPKGLSGCAKRNAVLGLFTNHSSSSIIRQSHDPPPNIILLSRAELKSFKILYLTTLSIAEIKQHWQWMDGWMNE